MRRNAPARPGPTDEPKDARELQGASGEALFPLNPTSKEAHLLAEDWMSSSPDKDVPTQCPATLEEPEELAQEETRCRHAGTGHQAEHRVAQHPTLGEDPGQ